MIKSLIGFAVVIAVCVASFNYVEGHESTKLKAEATRLEEKVESLRRARLNLDGKLRQACASLSEHEIEIDVCKKEEKEEKTSEEQVDD